MSSLLKSRIIDHELCVCQDSLRLLGHQNSKGKQSNTVQAALHNIVVSLLKELTASDSSHSMQL
jgi:hypothetical protein